MCYGDTFNHGGHWFRVSLPRDDDRGAPWDETPGHGPVSDWTRRQKAPGELVLCEDRGSRRYYDFAEACRIARRDDWGFLPGDLETFRNDSGQWVARVAARYNQPAQFESVAADINAAIRAVYAQHRATFASARAYAGAAAQADFERLRAWCNDDWHYVGVVVEMLDDDNEVLDSESLWGIESDAGAYLDDTARELADEILSRLSCVDPSPAIPPVMEDDMKRQYVLTESEARELRTLCERAIPRLRGVTDDDEAGRLADDFAKWRDHLGQTGAAEDPEHRDAKAKPEDDDAKAVRQGADPNKLKEEKRKDK